MYPPQTRNHQNTGETSLHSPRVFPTQQYLKFYWMCTIVKYSRWCTNFESLKNIEFCIFYVSAKDFNFDVRSRGGENVPHRTRTYLRYAYDNFKRSRPARMTGRRSEIAPCQGVSPEMKPHPPPFFGEEEDLDAERSATCLDFLMGWTMMKTLR